MAGIRLKLPSVKTVFAVVFLIFIASLLVSQQPTQRQNGIHQQMGRKTEPLYRNRSVKTILYFTPYFHMIDWDFGFGQQPFVSNNCPVQNCVITNNRSHLSNLNEFDAILFHIRDLKNAIPKATMRKPKQRYVMFLMESPMNADFPYDRFDGFFNWTMSFRLDSDFSRPYGWVEPIGDPFMYPPTQHNLPKMVPKRGAEVVPADLRQIVATKTRPVAWVVSNCGTHSQREQYVKELQKFIEVDVFGTCGHHKCSAQWGSSCITEIDRTYKFYLSFENSFCDGYVTEKFWNALSSESMVPVVLGAANYTAIAPPHSFIDASKFTPKELAHYLRSLDDEDILKFLTWKSDYRVVAKQNLAMCKLCEYLNDPDVPRKVYQDLKGWWVDQAHCQTKGSFPWSKKESFVNQIFTRLKNAHVIF